MKHTATWLGLLFSLFAGTFSSPALAQAAPWLHCAKEGGTCPAPAGTMVRYGANGQFLSVRSNGSVACGVSGFGGDPVHNVLKTCQYQPAVQAGWQHCAGEGQNCAAPAGAAVRYGANGKYFNAVSNGSVQCGVKSFGGDPVPNVLKACQYQPVVQQAWQQCATEGQNCAAPAGATVRYGVNGKYFNTVSKGNVHCGIKGFGGDPVPNVLKACQFQLAAVGPMPKAPSTTGGSPAKTYQIQWVQVGGPWKSPVTQSASPVCGHGAPGSDCGAGQNWKGQYPNGAMTQWRLGGCSKPVMTIQCKVN